LNQSNRIRRNTSFHTVRGQTMSEKQAIDLTRRRVLGGIGAIGVASAGAALGTSAYFSDEESFEGNSLTAGELDLFVHYDFTFDQGSASGNFEGPTSGIVQGDTDYNNEDEVSVSYNLTDVKPGDSGTLQFCPAIVDNPAWLWVDGELTENAENGYTEPEPDTADGGDTNDPGTPDGTGELADAIQITLAYCNEQGETLREMNNPDDYTLADLAAELGETDGFLLDGEPDSGGSDPFSGTGDPQEPAGPCLCIEWEVPVEVGNEIQTDSVGFDFTFIAEQSRHNENPGSPPNSST
jgi:predicted ribosomally synthesized peptide with SipW-like signal peptide